MIDTSTLVMFITLSLAIVAIPGPAVINIITHSMKNGYVVGTVVVLGTTIGSLIHVIAAAIGISAVLMTNPLLFEIINVASAVFLFYLTYRLIVIRPIYMVEANTAAEPESESLQTSFAHSITLSVLSPQKILFFIITVPQFIVPSSSAVAIPILTMSIVFLMR